MIMKGIGIPSGLQPSVAKIASGLLFLQKKDSYILKILLRFGDDLIKSMKEAKPTESNHFQIRQKFLVINNSELTLIHFLLEDYHYDQY